MDAFIFGFGSAVTLIVGVGLAFAITTNNRDAVEQEERRGEHVR
jgi:hypothetical protein